MDIVTWFLLALPLALDVFAVGLVFGMSGLERPRWLGVGLGFAVIGGTLIAVGLVLGEALEDSLGVAALYVAGSVLLVIGVRGLLHGMRGDEAATVSPDSRKIMMTGLVIAVDKLAVGLSLAVLGAPVGTMVTIVAGQTFAATVLGLALGKRLGARVGDAAEIIAGVVFVVLGLAVLFKAFTTRA